MREPYTQLFLHLVWATWDRFPWLVGDTREAVYDCLQYECTQCKTELIAIGGVADHVHVLVRVPPTLSVSDLVKQLKGSSSHFVTHRLGVTGFKWQGAYGAFTVDKIGAERVKSYILNQEAHHNDNTFWPDFELHLQAKQKE